MEIYVVQQGDTIDSIAQKFDISIEKLVIDNQINVNDKLVIGQTLVITHPEQVYTIREGDSLDSIAQAHNVTVMQLLRNNPWLSTRQYIFPGETLVISFNNDLGEVYVTGYTYPFIRDEVLRMTLPYMTYLLVYNYRVNSEGELIGGDEDEAVLQTAMLFDVPSSLVLTPISQTGEINLDVEYEILLNRQLQDRIIENLLHILSEKEYQGVNMAFQSINVSNQQLYIDFLINVWESLQPEGYGVFLTLNPGLSFDGGEITFEELNYAVLSQYCNGILFLSYDWGTITRSPMQISIVNTPSLLEYIVTQVPLEKIRVVLPTMGYDWRLPFVQGQSFANALNYDSVMELARQHNAVIMYDESTLSAYFEYMDINGYVHIVWFKDARSMDSGLKVLQSYGITGIGIWNILYYFAQLWLVINTQYDIVKL